MSSVQNHGYKQTNALYVPLGNCTRVLQFTPASGSGGSFQVGSFSNAAWATGGSAPSPYTSTISTIGAGGYFRDMGKTVVSASRTFRKVQLLVNSVVSTSGVAGPALGGAANVDYLTGYIEVAGNPAYGNAPVGTNPSNIMPVAMYPTIW
jgi:hypothetical protein